MHTPQVHVQIRLAVRVEPPDETGIIAAVIPFVVQYKAVCLLFRQTAHGRGRMQKLQKACLLYTSYLRAENGGQLAEVMKSFASPEAAERPVLLEVFKIGRAHV